MISTTALAFASASSVQQMISILGGLQSQKMGRKHSIMFDSVLFITATIIFILAKDLNMILIGRYIQGRVSLRFEFSD